MSTTNCSFCPTVQKTNYSDPRIWAAGASKCLTFLLFSVISLTWNDQNSRSSTSSTSTSALEFSKFILPQYLTSKGSVIIAVKINLRCSHHFPHTFVFWTSHVPQKWKDMCSDLGVQGNWGNARRVGILMKTGSLTLHWESTFLPCHSVVDYVTWFHQQIKSVMGMHSNCRKMGNNVNIHILLGRHI